MHFAVRCDHRALTEEGPLSKLWGERATSAERRVSFLDGITDRPQMPDRPVSPLIRAYPFWTVDFPLTKYTYPESTLAVCQPESPLNQLELKTDNEDTLEEGPLPRVR
jgi:hypothetical protein